MKMISRLENLVRQGEFGKAGQLLRELKIAEVPRPERLAYANVAGRLGDLVTGLRLLNPLIRHEIPSAPATPEERLQYASFLRKSGAVEEAIELILGFGPAIPEARLQLAFCYQSQWRYSDAALVLNKLVHEPGLEPYKTLVAKVNLLACTVHEENFVDARRWIKELEQELDGSASRLLYCNVLELAAQLDIRLRNYQSAVTRLEKASALIGNARESVSGMFVDKWLAICHSLRSERVTPELVAVEKRAESVHHWETVRDCVYYRALVEGDQKSLLRLYFGTPYPDFRQRIEKNGIVIPDSFLLTGTGRSSCVFDVSRAQTEDGLIHLQPGQSTHRLLIALSADLYRPLPLLAIFARLYPGEHYNPDTSPNRTHQVLKRFRKNPLELRSEECGAGYRLVVGGIGLRLPREPLPLEQKELELRKLKAALPPSGAFTTKEASVALGSSRSSAQRLLQWATDQGKLEPLGRGREARYTFHSQDSSVRLRRAG